MKKGRECAALSHPSCLARHQAIILMVAKTRSGGDEHPLRQRRKGVYVEVLRRELVHAQRRVRLRFVLLVLAREHRVGEVDAEGCRQCLRQRGDDHGRVLDVALQLQPKHDAVIFLRHDRVVGCHVAERVDRDDTEAGATDAGDRLEQVGEQHGAVHHLAERAVDVEVQALVDLATVAVLAQGASTGAG